MPDIIESPPLQHHKRYKTRDIETIHEAVADILVPHKVEVSRSGELDREAVLHHAPLPNGAIIYLVYGTEIRRRIATGFLPAGISTLRCVHYLLR
jgi:hypothetical protein